MIRRYFLLLLSAVILFPNNVCAMKRKRNSTNTEFPAPKRRKIMSLTFQPGHTIPPSFQDPFEFIDPSGISLTRLTELKQHAPAIKELTFPFVSRDALDTPQTELYLPLPEGLTTGKASDAEIIAALPLFTNLEILRLPGNYGISIPAELRAVLPTLKKLRKLEVNISLDSPDQQRNTQAAQKLLDFFSILPPQLESITIYGESFYTTPKALRENIGWNEPLWESFSKFWYAQNYQKQYLNLIGKWYQENIVAEVFSPTSPFPCGQKDFKILFIFRGHIESFTPFKGCVNWSWKHTDPNDKNFLYKAILSLKPEPTESAAQIYWYEHPEAEWLTD